MRKPTRSTWKLNHGRKHGRRYPWDDWFKRGSFTIQQGRDYTCMPHGMAQMIRNVATKRAMRVKLRIAEDGTITVTVLRAPRIA